MSKYDCHNPPPSSTNLTIQTVCKKSRRDNFDEFFHINPLWSKFFGGQLWWIPFFTCSFFFSLNDTKSLGWKEDERAKRMKGNRQPALKEQPLNPVIIILLNASHRHPNILILSHAIIMSAGEKMQHIFSGRSLSSFLPFSAPIYLVT